MVTASFWKRATLFVIASAGAALVAADEPKQAPAKQRRPRKGKRRTWPLHCATLGPITPNGSICWPRSLSDEPMSPTYGWFRTAVAQTRFDWESTRKRFDRDGDGRIARAEFPGGDADFARLDRDHDKALSAADFDFSASSLAPSPARWCFRASIATATARSRAMSSTHSFRAADSGGQGFLSLSDLQEVFDQPPRTASRSGSGMPSKATLVRGLFRQEIGSLQPGPRLDESAADFTLKTNDGKAEITLSKLIGPKPARPGLRQFHVRAVPQPVGQHREAVPPVQGPGELRDGLRPRGPSHRRLAHGEQRPLRSHDRAAQDLRRAGRSRSEMRQAARPRFPDARGHDRRRGRRRYSGMPGRLYLIDRDGKIAYQERRGPYLFKPAELEQSLVMLLQEGTVQGNQAHVAFRHHIEGKRNAGSCRATAARPSHSSAN